MQGYSSIMVGLDLGAGASERVKLAADLADRFNATLIGFACRQPMQEVLGDTSPLAAAILEQERRLEEEDLAKVEGLFRASAGPRSHTTFRMCTGTPSISYADCASGSDLLIVGRRGRADPLDWNFGVDPGDVVMQAGRPVLVVPPNISDLAAKRIVIAWKNEREARRAVMDALPLLATAEAVSIAAVRTGAVAAGLSDLESYLRRHEIAAKVAYNSVLQTESISDEIIAVAHREEADLIVAGAYGHSRMREWAFGGVTRALLDNAPVCCLLAH